MSFKTLKFVHCQNISSKKIRNNAFSNICYSMHESNLLRTALLMLLYKFNCKSELITYSLNLWIYGRFKTYSTPLTENCPFTHIPSLTIPFNKRFNTDETENIWALDCLHEITSNTQVDHKLQKILKESI